MNEVKLTLSNRETFIESFEAIDEDGDAIDLTGATIVFEVRDCRSTSSRLSATVGDGITINTTSFTVQFEVSDVTGFDAKNYNMGCTIEIDDITTQLFVGTLQIIDGVVP